MATMAKKRITILLIVTSVFVLGYAFFSLWRIGTSLAPDFSVYYASALRLLHNQNIYAGHGMFTDFAGPPTMLIVFIPFTWLPYSVAQGAWIILSFSALLYSIWMIAILIKESRWQWLLSAYILSFLLFPTRFTLGMGQVNLVAMALVLHGVVSLVQRKNNTGYVFITLSIILKPQLLFLLVPMGISLGLPFIGSLLGLYGACILGTIVVFGGGVWEGFVTRAFPMAAGFGDRGVYYNQSLSGALFRMLPEHIAAYATLILSGLVGIGFIWYVMRHHSSLTGVLAISLPVLLLLDPLSWQHHYVFILPALAEIWKRMSTRRDMVLWILSLILIGSNIKDPGSLQFGLLNGVILSHVFWGNLIVLYLLVKNGSTIQQAHL